MKMIANPINRFLKKYKGHLIHIIAEEYVSFVLRNLPSIEGILIRRMVYRSLFKKLGKGSLIYTGVYLTHTYGIEAGDFLSINSGALIDGRGGVTIGNGVMIGPNSVIVSSTHQIDRIEIPTTSLDHIMQPVRINNNVWIGSQVFIKGGVEIGSGAVIAAGAVVVDAVPEYKIVAGNPAKIIKDRKI